MLRLNFECLREISGTSRISWNLSEAIVWHMQCTLETYWNNDVKRIYKRFMDSILDIYLWIMKDMRDFDRISHPNENRILKTYRRVKFSGI